MRTAPRQGLVISALLLLGAASLWAAVWQSLDRVLEVGFWFEPVTYRESEPMVARLGGAITPGELSSVADVARAEVEAAFAGLRVTVSERRDAAYRVKVVQSLQDGRWRRKMEVAGESRGIWGLGGQGAVSFRLLASAAIGFAPPDADRTAMLHAIGRGIGRAAVHEFAHQFLGTAPIHDSTDVRSFEYASAHRREQYYGPMRWAFARPLLEERLGTVGLSTSD